MTVLVLLIKASALLGIVALLNRLSARRASAAVRHGMWTLAIAGLLLLPLLSLAVPALSLPVLPARAETRVMDLGGSLAPAAGSPAPTAASRVERPIARAPVPPTIPDASSVSWPVIALAVYLAGVLLLAVRLAADHLAARRLVARASAMNDPEWTALVRACRTRLGVNRPVRLLRAAEAVMPMTVGLRQPSILVSRAADGWTADRRRAVILHELAHVARHDCLTQGLASIAVALYWIHPGVWWVARRLQLEREYACDDLVLATGSPAREYAGHLLDIAYSLGTHRAPALAVTMARTSQLEGRLLAVLDAARNRATPGLAGRLAAGLVALALVLPLAAVSTTERVAARTLPVIGATAGAGAPDEDAPSPPLSGARRDQGEAQAIPSMSGTWELQSSEHPGQVYLELRQAHSSSGRTIPLSSLEGLSAAEVAANGPAKFDLRRDAGTFTFTGTFRDGAGAGTYGFTPSPTFPAELARRGVGRPTPGEQHELARHDVGLALVDELRSQGYQTPTVADLVQMGHHGVTAEYVKAMGGLGYKVGTVAALVNMRDHGVTPDYVEGLTAAGLPKLTAEGLVRARDHGVTPDFVKALAGLGYTSLGIEALVNARDHGVTPDFVHALGAHGYTKLTLDQLVNARDHGVTPDFVTTMGEMGYASLPIETLVNARDHGVTPEFVKAMAELGYAKLPVEALVKARDHGVTPDYVSGLKALGYDSLPLDELVTLRDHGVTPERAKRANERAGTRLPPDMLRSLADGGLR